jgi:hypothetical protein
MWRYFDRRVCMNLDKRKDRWIKVCKEFDRVGLMAERFQAHTEDDHGGNRFLAYNHTYWNILNGGEGSILVLEDDVEFRNCCHLGEALSELPDDWDVLYLGANLNGTLQERYSNNLFKIKNSLTTHAVAYSDKMRRKIVESFDPDTFPVYDEWLRVNVQEKYNCFVIAPMIAWQSKGWSDLWQTMTDYSATFIDGDTLLK